MQSLCGTIAPHRPGSIGAPENGKQKKVPVASIGMLGVDNEALPVNTPLNKQAAVQLESIMQSDAETALQQAKEIGKHHAQKYTSEFTFHPRVSSASSRIVENSGMDFLTRQQRHVEKQKKLLEENRALHQDLAGIQSDCKRQKIAAGTVRSGVLMDRPGTGDRNLLKKRNRLPRNKLRQTSVDERMETDIPGSPVFSSSSPPSLPPRSKTYHTLSQSMVSSGNFGTGAVRKRNAVDPYANFDRLQRAKQIAEKAIKNKKIFSIHGPYSLIRKALRERGWVEKEFKLPPRMKNNNKHGDSSDVDDIDDDDDYDDDVDQKDSGIGMSPRPPFEGSDGDKVEDDDDCYGIMGRMARNEVPIFQWTTRTSSIDWRTLQKDQIVNHFAKANFTTKVEKRISIWGASSSSNISHVGLCMNLRTLPCFTECSSDSFFPRCYRLSNEEEKMDFIDDFRLTAAVSILKIVIARHSDNYGQNSDKVQNGQMPSLGGPHIVPVDILQLALRVCDLHVKEREHEDIDQDDYVCSVSDAAWDQLIFHYMKLAHEGAMIAQSASYYNQCEVTLEKIQATNPQFFIEGVKNTWIIKPGAKSRGRGILVMNRLDEILKLVSGDPNLIKDSRWVVQKYIERPLLIFATKFDVRQWFLVSDWNPLVIWIYRDSYLRFSSRPFTLKQLDASIHLCNYSVQKNFEIDSNRHPSVPADNMWSDEDFRNYLRTRGCHTLWDDLVFPGMKKAIIHICQTALDVVEYRKGSFELYGADFMIDENYNPWLIEVNSSPTMARSTQITSKLCASVQEDVLKVILDRKRDKNCDIGQFEMIYKQPAVDIPLYVGKALNVEGITIKKPYSNPIRRINNPPVVALTTTRTSALRYEANKENVPTVMKAVSKTASIYGQSVANRVAKVSVRSNHTPPGAAGLQSRGFAGTQNRESRQSSRLADSARPSSPVKIKMQNTLKRLATEASNTPPKPNALNLPRPPASSALNQIQDGHGNGHSTAAQGSTKVNNYSQTRVNRNSSVYSIRVTGAPDSNNTAVNSSGSIHFVSSPHAKAASAMGIMHYGSNYNSMIAAANRGCYPGNRAMLPHPPQAVVPKTFPASSVAGGELLAGGETVVHPPPPPGVMALAPQTIGLSLPFQRYFSVDQAGVTAGHHTRRNVAYGGVPDVRLGGAARPRVSGIQEWLRQQQSESGFSVCCYYPNDNDSAAIDKPNAAAECADFENLVYACDANDNTTANADECAHDPSQCSSCCKPRHCFNDSRPPGCLRHSSPSPNGCPFKSSFAVRSHRRKPALKSFATDGKLDECLKGLDFLQAPSRSIQRGHTAGNVFNGKKTHLPTPSFIYKLFSLKHRHERNIHHKKDTFLSVTCSSS